MATIVVSHFMNVGQLGMYTADYIPPGWLPMDGNVRAKANYPELFSVIPDLWKDGTNFTLPKHRSFGWQSSAKAVRSSNQPIPNATATIVTFTEAFDNGDYFDSGDPGQMELPQDGVYEVHAEGRWTFANNTTEAIMQILMGSDVVSQEIAVIPTEERSAHSLSAIVSGVAGDLIKMRVTQSSGSTMSIASASLAVIQLSSDLVQPIVAIYAGR